VNDLPLTREAMKQYHVAVNAPIKHTYKGSDEWLKAVNEAEDNVKRAFFEDTKEINRHQLDTIMRMTITQFNNML